MGKLEEDARSHRNCKCVYSLLTSKAAAAMLYSLVADGADIAGRQLARLQESVKLI